MKLFSKSSKTIETVMLHLASAESKHDRLGYFL